MKRWLLAFILSFGCSVVAMEPIAVRKASISGYIPNNHQIINAGEFLATMVTLLLRFQMEDDREMFEYTLGMLEHSTFAPLIPSILESLTSCAFIMNQMMEQPAQSRYRRASTALMIGTMTGVVTTTIAFTAITIRSTLLHWFEEDTHCE